MAVRLILACWVKKQVILYFVDMMHVEFMKNFLLVDSSDLMAVRLILASWAQKQVILYFVDMMYVEFMKNFLFTPIRAISWLLDSFLAPWGRKQVIPTL